MQKKYFGHWEIDTLIGTKTKDDSVLLTLVERKTRFKIMLKIHQKSKEFVNKAMKQLYERIGNQAANLFKTITSDNGSEFAGIYEMLTGITDVYVVQPYASYERGTKENQHKLVRRFIPKGECLADISANTINQIQNWMNNIPRKLLGYRTAKKAFLDELKAFVEQQ